MLKKLYKQNLLKVYNESSVYNIAQFYTMEQQAIAQEAVRLHYAMDDTSDKSISIAFVSHASSMPQCTRLASYHDAEVE